MPLLRQATSVLRLHPVTTAALVVAIVSLSQTLYVLKANKTYEETFSAMKAAAEAAEVLEVGLQLGDIRGIDLKGDRTQVTLRNGIGPTLLLLISTTCDPCTRSMPHMLHLASKATSAGYRVVWASRDSLEIMLESREASSWPGAVILEPTYGSYVNRRLARVPQTAIVTPSGHVERAWRGALDADRAREIESALGTAGNR